MDELVGIAALIGQYHTVLALALCIGNEGLTFHRYTLEDLRLAAERLNALLGAVRVPLCTSEPFAAYAEQALWHFGEFLAPNIHPVFDTQLGPPEAAAWSRARALALAATAGKPVLVKETGFPHGGEPRFTPETQRAFWAAYVAGGRLVRVPTHPKLWVSHAVAFEAFDLPWKAAQTQMPIEQAWGLLSSQRAAFPAFWIWHGLRQQRD